MGQDVTGTKMQIEARDAMNGTLLWAVPAEFPMGSNADAHREYFVANERHLYTYPERSGPLTCFNTRTGAIVRQFKDGPIPIPFLGTGIDKVTAERANWKQLMFAQVVLSGKYVLSIFENHLHVYDDASGALLWKKEFPGAARMRASIGHGRIYLVVEDSSLDVGRVNPARPGAVLNQTGFSSLSAYDLATGKDVWKSDMAVNPGTAFIYIPPTVVGDQLNLALKYYRLEGAKGGSGNSGGLPATWLFAGVDAATGKVRWKESTKDGGGTIDASIWWISGHFINAEGILWIGYTDSATGIDTKNGKLAKTTRLAAWNCHWARGVGNYYTVSQNFLNTNTLARSLANGVRTGCNDGLFFAYGANYIWSQSCPCGLFLIGKAATISAPPPKPVEDGQRLEAFSPSTLTTVIPPDQQWPSYMGNSERGGITASALPSAPTQAWKVSLGETLKTGVAADWASDSILRPVTPPVAEGQMVVVARPQAHTVVGLDAASGTVRWTTNVGGRVDSSPTLYRGHVYVGCRDGYVYCLGLNDGKIRWRYLVATNREQMVFASQLESKWPVLGTTLVHDGALYACGGRHSQLDGGLTVAKLNPASGQQIWRSTISSVPNYFNSILNEPLLVAKGLIWMGKVSLNPKDGAVLDEIAQTVEGKAAITFADEAHNKGPRLPTDNVPSNTGNNRLEHMLKKSGNKGISGMVGLNQSMLVPGAFVQFRGGSCMNAAFDGAGTITVGIHGYTAKGSGTTPRGMRSYAPGSTPLASSKDPTVWFNPKQDASAIVANATQVGVVEIPGKGVGNLMFSDPKPSTWTVFRRADGTPVGEPLKLPGTVTWRGAATADGKLFFSFEDGSVGCWK
jgi:outer membrane protein assembly factor BamB